MTIGVVGRKCGMTRIFTDEGASIPVTVIEVEPNRVTQVKTKENDGYEAIQITTGVSKSSRLTKPLAGHYAKVGIEPGRDLWEFRLDDILTLARHQQIPQFKIGDEIKVDIFSAGQKVDVVSLSKGKGFQGVIKRHNFTMGDASHGNSLSHRVPGSIGQRQSPGRVFKGKKMAGHMGNKRCTVHSQKVIRIDKEKNLLLIQGTVPGAPGNNVIIVPAVKEEQSTGGR